MTGETIFLVALAAVLLIMLVRGGCRFWHELWTVIREPDDGAA